MTPRTILVAGASGVIGRALLPILMGDGWRVVALTRRQEKIALLEGLGAHPFIADVFDREALFEAVDGFRPNVVMSQVTDLPPGLDLALMNVATERNARVRGCISS